MSTLTLAAVYGILASGASGWFPAALVTLLFALSSSAMLGANTMLLTFIPQISLWLPVLTGALSL